MECNRTTQPSAAVRAFLTLHLLPLIPPRQSGKQLQKLTYNQVPSPRPRAEGARTIEPSPRHPA